jgi:hypothetical protein
MTGQIIMGGATNPATRPKMPGRFYKTYQIAAPIDTHTRRATCAEIDCTAYLEGWTYPKSKLVAEDLYDLVTHAGKRYREVKLDDSSETYLVFEPGQMCFQAATHRLSLERPELFFAGRGHFRSGYSARSANRFDNGEDWADSFATHQEIINRIVEEGL